VILGDFGIDQVCSERLERSGDCDISRMP